MARLLDGLVANLPDDARSSLVDRSEGVPLFAVETVRSLIDRDVVVPRGGQYVLADPEALDLESLGAPASLQALIAARLDTLEPDQRRVVDRACIFGSALTRHEIASLSPDVADIDAVLESLTRLELLRQESSRFSTDLGRYQFVQGAVRQVAYGTLSRHDRKAGHLALVDVLQAEESTAVEHAAVVASHLLESIDTVPDAPDAPELTARAIDALREAATRASNLGAPSEAAAHLDAAMARCTDEVLGASIEQELARELDRAGDIDRAIEHATHAIETFDRLGDVAGAGSTTAMWAASLLSRSDHEQARRHALERYEAVRGRGDLPRVEMELIRALTIGYVRNGGEDLLRYAVEYARLAEYLGDRGAIVDSYNALSVHFLRDGVHGMSQLLLDAAVDHARELHDNRALARALLNLNAEFNPLDVVRAAAYGREAVHVTKAVGDRTWVSSAAINAVHALLLLGAWDELLRLIDEDVVLPHELPYVQLSVAAIRHARGEVGSMDLTSADMPDRDPASAAVQTLVRSFSLIDSDPGTAADLAVSAVRAMFEFGGFYDDFTLVFVLATDLMWELDDHAALHALMEIIPQDRRERPPHGLLAQKLRMQALSADRDGLTDSVEADLEDALELAETWGSEPWTARIQADLATFLKRQGRPEEAAPYAEKARATFSRLGAGAWSQAFESTLTGSQV